MMKAVALISGGLDSILAARIIMEQGFEVTGLYFTSAFSKSYGKEEHTPAAQVAASIGIELRVLDLGRDYIDLIRNPKHGYGKNINPCIDCKIFMLEKSKPVMDELRAPCIITGEVLGQRPMSQRRDTLQVIERDSGLKGMILRPLSAKLLSPTRAEQDGRIQREKLYGISGRSRNEQFRLAEQFGVTGFSAPAGGCLLTDNNFADKLRDLFHYRTDVAPDDIRLLTHGRHFRSPAGAKIIMGRDKSENLLLLSWAGKRYHVFMPHDFPGPLALLDGEPSSEEKNRIGNLILRYGKKVPGRKNSIRFGSELFEPDESPEVKISDMKPLGVQT